MDQLFWDQQHTTSNSTWLTGSLLTAYWDFFQITADDLRDKKILEIGVGLGRASRELAKVAGEFYCADISQTALDKLEDCTPHRFLTQDLKNITPADVVICHLVTVHCTDDEVVRMINDVRLSAAGKMLVQFSGPSDDGEISDRARATFVEDGSHHFRKRQQIQDLVSKTNKQIDQMLSPRRVNHDGWFDHDWHPVIIVNK